MLLQVKAKVKLYSEDDLEMEDLDMGTIISKNPQWGWRDTAILEDEIYKIMAFSKGKSIIQMYDKELILVNEPFEQVYEKWNKAKRSSKEPFDDPDSEGNNEESENFNEEEES